MEDKTKRGLTVKETSVDEKLNVKADKGMIHDMDGIGHWVQLGGIFQRNLTILMQFQYMQKPWKKNTQNYENSHVLTMTTDNLFK